jgi:hypothetical protein
MTMDNNSNESGDAYYLLLLQKHAGAGAHLALDALPGLIVSHHRLLQLILGLHKTQAPNQSSRSTQTIISQSNSC